MLLYVCFEIKEESVFVVKIGFFVMKLGVFVMKIGVFVMKIGVFVMKTGTNESYTFIENKNQRR